MVGYFSEREFFVLNPIGIDAVLQAHGITDKAKLETVSPQRLGQWLGADAVVYGEVLNYEAYYLALVSAWQSECVAGWCRPTMARSWSDFVAAGAAWT